MRRPLLKSGKKKTMEYFKKEPISEHITAIRGITNEIMYLVVGKEKACLIDTGIGYGDLLEYVRNITNLPLIVLLTHGHLDHTGNSWRFEQVYIDKYDEELFGTSYSRQAALDYIHLVIGDDRFNSIDENLLKDKLKCKLNYYEANQNFNLGGVNLSVIECPGHTKGSVSILVNEDRKLIIGDACNNATYLFFDESLGVKEYKTSLCKLNENSDKWDRLLFSHYFAEGPKEIIDNVIDVCNMVLDGRADNEPYEFMGDKGYVAIRVKDLINCERYDKKLGNIIYSKV